MSAVAVFETVSRAYSYIFENFLYFLRSILFILPLMMAVYYLLPFVTNRVERPDWAAITMIVIFVPTLLAYMAFGFSWYSKALNGGAAVQSPFEFSAHFVLFIKKFVLLGMIGILTSYIATIVGAILSGLLEVMNPAFLNVGLLITYILFFGSAYLLLPLVLVLPAATQGQNLKLVDAFSYSAPYRLGLVISVVAGMAPVMMVTSAAQHLMNKFGLLDSTASFIPMILAYIPFSISELLTSAIGIVILCEFYRIIMGVKRSSGA